MNISTRKQFANTIYIGKYNVREQFTNYKVRIRACTAQGVNYTQFMGTVICNSSVARRTDFSVQVRIF